MPSVAGRLHAEQEGWEGGESEYARCFHEMERKIFWARQVKSRGHFHTACNARDPSLIPGSRRSPREGSGNPLQDSCLENSVDRGARGATVHGVAKSRHHWVTNSLTSAVKCILFLLTACIVANFKCFFKDLIFPDVIKYLIHIKSKSYNTSHFVSIFSLKFMWNVFWEE